MAKGIWGSEWPPWLYYRMTQRQRFGGGGGGSASFSPDQIAGLFAWYDPSDLSTLFQERTGASATTPSEVDGVVGTVLDKSGNGHHYVAPADGQRPLLKNSGAIYWLELDGSDDVLRVAFTEFAQPYVRISAMRQLSWTNDRRILGCGSTAAIQLIQSGSSPAIAMNCGGSNDPATSDAAIGVDVVLIEVANGASSSIAVDSGTPVTGDPGSANANGSGVGGNADGQGGHIRLSGQFLFDRLLTDPEIALLRTYLAAKQGRVL